ncbi:bifunctional helix-turn-helix transcriptional regulator/GNAT family N-acetyltransferase [Nocardia huaxiensis]|uniref:bifunctional helix-turn-helix transcriptional regulator/GNAT family N-acetyltransferase n=1 Tax=Nocardia huaxiensis TaxID=2755382 RepID=UPI001E63B762|nr:helix-turn-helix domain-containing GNAT family N-acetyltransferase [Nocardia huaxiensis]UFS99408.1 helix-turn-helix domain-containing GNAT family N-acetyltransferase [Nocardia huaxiensis]
MASSTTPDTGAAPAAEVDIDHIAAVRDFNRRYTRVIGVLRGGLVGTEYTLTEARILFELANFGAAEAVGLRRDLDLDAGYLSRILTRFETKGLVTRTRSETDGRRQLVALTELGRDAFAELDRRSHEQVGELLDPHSPDTRTRLVGAMRTIEQILDAPEPDPARVTVRAPRPGEHGWVIQRNAALYAAEFGWNADYEALVAHIVAEFLNSHDPQRERAWIAEYQGEPVGCVYCVREDDTTARLRLLLVEPTARGLGVGTALVDECLRFATAAGYQRMVLWTNDVLASARRIYERAGFELTAANPHHSFGVDLVGQTWQRALP